MERWVGQVAFVSGTSSGIGKAIAVQLVEHGLKVVGFARRHHLLEEPAVELSSKKGKFYPYPGDASSEQEILNAFQWTRTNVGPVSIVINNAAVLNPSKLTVSETKLWRQELDINVLAACITAREAINQMKENNIDGHIININSIAGHKVAVSAALNLYGITKHALRALTETLRLELAQQGSKIKVSSLSPGCVRTDMLSSAIEGINAPKDLINSCPSLKTSDIANAVLYVLGTPATVNISELTIQMVGEKM